MNYCFHYMHYYLLMIESKKCCHIIVLLVFSMVRSNVCKNASYRVELHGPAIHQQPIMMHIRTGQCDHRKIVKIAWIVNSIAPDFVQSEPG